MTKRIEVFLVALLFVVTLFMPIIEQATTEASIKVAIREVTLVINVAFVVGAIVVLTRILEGPQRPGERKDLMIVVTLVVTTILILTVNQVSQHILDANPAIRDAQVEIGPEKGECSGAPPAIFCNPE